MVTLEQTKFLIFSTQQQRQHMFFQYHEYI